MGTFAGGTTGCTGGDEQRNGAIVLFFDDVGVPESRAVPGDGPDEARLARVVTERAPDRANRLTQRAVRDDDVAPDTVEDVAPMDRLVPALDEKDQEVEISWNERLLASIGAEHAAARRHDVMAEAVAGHPQRPVRVLSVLQALSS